MGSGGGPGQWRGRRSGPPLNTQNRRRASAADLKSLRRKRRTHPRDFKSKSGTRIINLLVPIAFRSSRKIGAARERELRKVGTSLVRHHFDLAGLLPARPRVGLEQRVGSE